MSGRKDYTQARRLRLRAAGLCRDCATRPVMPGNSRCEPCRDWDTRQQRLRREQATARGLCVHCGRKPRALPRTHCQHCLDALARRRKGWASMGLCAGCGGFRDDPARKHCALCRDNCTAWKQARKRSTPAPGPDGPGAQVPGKET